MIKPRLHHNMSDGGLFLATPPYNGVSIGGGELNSKYGD